MKDWFTYISCVVIGLLISSLSGEGSTTEYLLLMSALTITAYVASLLVPFAGFSVNEAWQKWCVQFAPVPLIGMMAAAIGGIGTPAEQLAGYFALLMATATHFGYWMSGLHSRNYRFNRFINAYSATHPTLCQWLVHIGNTGQHENADNIIRTFEKSGTIKA